MAEPKRKVTTIDGRSLTWAETRACGARTILCTQAVDEAVHWCPQCERFTDEVTCHRCNPCAACVAAVEEHRLFMVEAAAQEAAEEAAAWTQMPLFAEAS